MLAIIISNRTDNNDGKNGGGGWGSNCRRVPELRDGKRLWVWVSEEGKVGGTVTTPLKGQKLWNERTF